MMNETEMERILRRNRLQTGRGVARQEEEREVITKTEENRQNRERRKRNTTRERNKRPDEHSGSESKRCKIGIWQGKTDGYDGK